MSVKHEKVGAGGRWVSGEQQQLLGRVRTLLQHGG